MTRTPILAAPHDWRQKFSELEPQINEVANMAGLIDYFAGSLEETTDWTSVSIGNEFENLRWAIGHLSSMVVRLRDEYYKKHAEGRP